MVSISCSLGIAIAVWLQVHIFTKAVSFDEIRPKLLARPLCQWKHKTYCTATSIMEYIS